MSLGAILALVLQAPQAAAEPAAERYAGAELVLRSYLTLAAVDARGRRPFRPDAVLARYLIEPGSAAPVAGESVKGETGEAAWSACTAGEDGRVGEAAWAYSRVESDAARVVLARLDGAAQLFVNGVPHAGDLYGLGFGGVPVELVQGRNELYVTGVRGAFRLSLVPCTEGLVIGGWDLTVPTLTVGEPGRVDIGVPVLNASRVEVPALAVELVDGGGILEEKRLGVRGGLVALGQRKLALHFSPRPGARLEAPGEVHLRLRVSGHPDGRSVEHALTLAVRTRGELGVRTRVSAIDGSVQKYAVLPPAEPRAQSLRLLLTLHGAGVDCEGQAGSYAAKPDFWIVAPTNRRPFGFDWQDWGRADAYETLAAARLLPGAAAAPVYLAGHSMGGHGTWHLAANDPDTFAAIAPSAGWRSFDSYGGRPEGALRALWHAADAGSRSEDLLANLVQLPTYVLHGEADDNVPASEGHAMVEALRAAGAEPESHFQPGAGHWWDDEAPGAACLDWPGIFALFRRTTPVAEPRALDWHGLDLGLDSVHHWVEVEQLLAYGQPFHVGAQAAEDGRVRLVTTNVRRLGVHPPDGFGVGEVELDGQVLALPAAGFFEREGADWRPARPRQRFDLAEKRPWANGPLKRAFARDFVLVVPTLGSPEENAAALARARHDAEVWAYRGNGETEILTDRRFQNGGREWNGIILYGNADTNAAFGQVVPPAFPLRVTRGRVRLGEAQWEGAALGALAVGSTGRSLFAVLGSSGPAAERVGASLSLFVSGVGYPDYVVYGPEVLAEGDGGVRAAGFFDHRWQLALEKDPRGR